MVEIIKVTGEKEMALVYGIRTEVFIKEQGVPFELEMDELDKEAIHVLACSDGTPAGCGRLLLKGNDARLGRVAVLKEMRRQGLGAAICKLLINLAGNEGVQKVYLDAQLSAVGFYESLGFKQEGAVFPEANIPHIRMEKNIT